MGNDATWIWPAQHADPDDVNQFVEFRQEFILDQPPGEAIFSISADTNYAAWINGTFVGTGQFTDYPDRKSMDEYGVTDAIRPGRNVVSILVHYCGVSHQSYIKGRPGVLFLLCSGRTLMCSGSSTGWRVSSSYRQGPMPRYSPQLPFTFEYDARRDDGWCGMASDPSGGWTRVREDDMAPASLRPVAPRLLRGLEIRGRAPVAIVAQGMFRRTASPGTSVAGQMQTDFLSSRTALEMFPLIAPGGALCWTPVSLDQPLTICAPESGADGVFMVLDLGRNECGYLDLEMDTNSSAVVDVAYGEHLDDLRVRALIQNRNFASRVVTGHGRLRFTYYITRWACRYLQVHVSGQDEEVVLHYAGLLPADYPVTEKGRFDSSDRLFRRIHEVGVRTLKLCMHEHYEDTPWREQGLYANDARNQALCGFYCFGDYQFPQVSFELLGRGLKDDGYLELCAPAEIPITIPAFSLVWIIEVMETVLFSGDVSFARRMLPIVQKMVHTYTASFVEDLFPSQTGERFWHFYDWDDGLHGEGGDACHFETLRTIRFDAPLNAFLVRALDAGARLGSWCGDESFSGHCRSAARRVRRVFHDAFWDPDAGLYQMTRGTKADAPASELVQALAMCGGVCDKSTADSLRSRLVEPENGLVNTTLSQSIYKFEALLQDRESYGPAVFEAVTGDWGGMLFAGATSFWETLKGGWDFDGAGSLSHAWSAIPVYLFGAYLVGVRPRTPGFASFEVNPVWDVVHWCRADIPTPAGPIEVECEDSRGRRICHVRHPEGIQPRVPGGGVTYELHLEAYLPERNM